MKGAQTLTMTIYTEAKINRKEDPQLALESVSQAGDTPTSDDFVA